MWKSLLLLSTIVLDYLWSNILKLLLLLIIHLISIALFLHLEHLNKYFSWVHSHLFCQFEYLRIKFLVIDVIKVNIHIFIVIILFAFTLGLWVIVNNSCQLLLLLLAVG